MINITKFVLQRPVTAVLCVVSLAFFGLMSLLNARLELTPEMNMPMLIVLTTYAGASPSDINELITKEIEDELGSLSDVDEIIGSSSENYSMVVVQYEYGTDMDNAYMELYKTLNNMGDTLPDDADEPLIYELDINSMASFYMVVTNDAVENIYNYCEKNIIPDLEKLSPVASVDIYGGQEAYVSVELDPVKLDKYGLDISTVASMVGAANFTIPAGSADVGNVEMSISMEVEYDTPESLAKIPITLGNGNIIYLEDIADVSRSKEEMESIGRYNGADTVILAVSRNTQYTDVDVSNEVKAVMAELDEEDENLHFEIVNDGADDILDSLTTMVETMISVIILSAVILFIFYGDVKASLIVATSIPISILTAFVMMWAMDYSFNVVTLGSIVLGVGMMVDNSIVVLESCFRAKENNHGEDFMDYVHSALSGTKEVVASVLGSTITTCVVFLPLGMISGLSGQMFQPLGFTIVFCMVASLLSACSIVPLCFVYYKPEEKEKAPAYRAIRSMQEGYRGVMAVIMGHKKTALAVTAAILAVSLFAGTKLDMVLMPDIDQGQVQITIETRENLTVEKQTEIFEKIEQIVGSDSDVEKYMLSGGSGLSLSSGSTMLVYLKDDRELSTDEHIAIWKDELQAVDNCDITVETYSQMSAMTESSDFSVTLEASDYDELEEASDNIYEALRQDNRVTAVTSSLANTSPVIKIKVDPVQAAAEGLTPASVGANLYTMLSGTEADTMDVDDVNISIMVEYADDEYDTLNKVRDIVLTSSTGNTVFLRDIADIVYEDSPSSITRYDKKYHVEITAGYTDLADETTEADLHSLYVEPNLSSEVEEVDSSTTERMNEEFSSLGTAIVVAIFLVFVVMAAQFESPRFSGMVMATLPFAMIGALGFLWLWDLAISMVSLMGFLMLIGTVVNNGILYVDTVDQRREAMGLEEALVEAGVIRLRPILMTTLTTVIGMLPMAIGLGGSAEMMRSIAMVDIGGLITSTLMALLVLPVLYYYVNGNRDRRKIVLD